MRTRRAWEPKHFQLFTYIKANNPDFEYRFIAEVLNREFQTNEYDIKRLRYGWKNFQKSGKQVETTLIPEWIDDCPAVPAER